MQKDEITQELHAKKNKQTRNNIRRRNKEIRQAKRRITGKDDKMPCEITLLKTLYFPSFHMASFRYFVFFTWRHFVIISSFRFYEMRSFFSPTFFAAPLRQAKSHHVDVHSWILLIYYRTLRTHHHIFFSSKTYMRLKSYSQVLMCMNMNIYMNQSFIWLHYHATLLMTCHGYIQHPAPFCTVKWSFLIIFMFKLWRVWHHKS